MTIAIFGSTGGVGRRVVEQALAAGYNVRALVRDPAKSRPENAVTTVIGDITDADAVERTVETADGVIWAVGATRNSRDQVPIFESGARNLVAAMKRHGVRRLVALSGAAITLDGERKPVGGRLMSAIVGRLVRHVVEAKRREYEVFKASDLDWTLVRPPRVVEGPPTGRYAAGNLLVGRTVLQGDLADFMLREVRDEKYLRAAPYISS
jgi:putative NADH-flavin reductase